MSRNIHGLPTIVDLLPDNTWVRITTDGRSLPWVNGAVVQIVERTRRSGSEGDSSTEDCNNTDYRVETWKWQVAEVIPISSVGDCGNLVVPYSYLKQKDEKTLWTEGDQVILTEPLTLTYRHVDYTFPKGSRGVIIKRTTRRPSKFQSSSRGDSEKTVNLGKSTWDVTFGLAKWGWVRLRYSRGINPREVVQVPARSREIPRGNTDEVQFKPGHMW